jgi:hypothetical protein
VPAKSTEQLFATHSQYLDASISQQEDFRNALNEVMPRIYKMGYWREMLVEHTQDASAGYVSLPQDTDSIITGILDNNPLPTRSLWHDYKLFGTNKEDKTNMSAFIDDGYAPTYRDLDSDSQYKIVIATVKEPFTDFTPTGTLNIRYRQHSDVDEAGAAVVAGATELKGVSFSDVTQDLSPAGVPSYAQNQGHQVSIDEDISEILSITWSKVTEDYPFIVKAVYTGPAGVGNSPDSTKDLLLAEINTSFGSSRYRRFRVGGTDSTSKAHMLLKRRWVDVDGASDLVHMPSNAILKHALLGKLSEDNADIQRAQYHWGLVAQLLESDTDSYRGAAKPTLHIAPDGVGAGMSGMY